MSSSEVPFNPLQQGITFVRPDGSNITIPLEILDSFVKYDLQLVALYVSQLGATLLMLLVTATLTKPANRRKPMFSLNMLSLLFGVLRALFLTLYVISPWNELYRFVTSDYSTVPQSATSISILGAFFPLAMTLTVNAALVLQANTVSKIMRKHYYYPLTAMSCIIYLLAAAFRLGEFITNTMSILGGAYYLWAPIHWLTTATLASETAAILWFSMIFTTKLAWTLHTRRKLGFQRMSYMQILAIMGGCTMIIPAIFFIIQCTPLLLVFPESGTMVLTTVSLLLPLSSLWAAAETAEQSSIFNLSNLWATRKSRNSDFAMATTDSTPSLVHTKDQAAQYLYTLMWAAATSMRQPKELYLATCATAPKQTRIT